MSYLFPCVCSGYEAWSTFLDLGDFFFKLVDLKKRSKLTFEPAWEYFEDMQFLLTPLTLPFETPPPSDEDWNY